MFFSAETMENTTTNATACEQVLGTSYVYFAYLITMVIVFSGTIPFFVIYFKGAGNQQHVKAADRSNLPYPAPLPVKQKALFLTLLFFTFFTYCAVEDTFSGYLATFCINYFKWDTSKSSFVTSLHWASFSIGRFSGIFLVRYFKSVQLLIAYMVLLVLSFVGFLTCSLTYASSIFWLFVALPGVSMSIVYPCIFTWTEESILKVSGTVSSIFLIASSVGFTINPLLLGYLMDNKSPIWFVYILLGEAVLCFTTVLIVFRLSRTFVTVLVPDNGWPTTEESIPGQVTHL